MDTLKEPQAFAALFCRNISNGGLPRFRRRSASFQKPAQTITIASQGNQWLNSAFASREAVMATAWRLSGDYFENCSCHVVCTCLVSTKPQLTSKPTQGVCNVPLAFHIETGNYGDVSLDG